MLLQNRWRGHWKKNQMKKLMAISEYSDTVMENMNKTHNEIMFTL